MERELNAKGASCTTGVPLSQATHPRTPYQQHPESRPFMNNLKERNSVLNGLQETSEDPPGFIYPSYRAAGTEASIDKPPLKDSHQGVAYVSSSVGGSVSILSFEETITKKQLSPPKRHGRGMRERVRGF